MDALALGLPGDLRTQKVLVQLKALNHLERIFGIVLAGNRVQDSAPVKLLDDRGDAALQPQPLGAVLDQYAVPQCVIQIPYHAFDFFSGLLRLACRLAFRQLRHKVHQAKVQRRLPRLIVRDKIDAKGLLDIDQRGNGLHRNPDAVKSRGQSDQLLERHRGVLLGRSHGQR